MRQVSIAIGSVCCVLFGCSGPETIEPIHPDVTQFYAQLVLNHKAIVLSVEAPYDTVQLTATPQNFYGATLPYTGTIQFRRINLTDTSITVNESGFVRAISPTNMTKVEVSLTIDGITQYDTTMIMVRNDVPLRKATRIDFQPVPPDSSWRWAGEDTNIGYEKWVKVYDDNNTLIPSKAIVVAYSWDDNRIVIGKEDVSTTTVLGETYIRVRTYAYGKELIDSVLFKRVEPTVKFVAVQRIVPEHGEPTMAFYPSELTIPKGGTVIFLNAIESFDENYRCDYTYLYCGNQQIHYEEIGDRLTLWLDSVDIAFESPASVAVGDSYGKINGGWFKFGQAFKKRTWPSDGGSGNIGLFGMYVCYDQGTDVFPGCGGATSVIDWGYRSRKFLTPGIYRYSSPRYPNAHGTIVVKD